MKSLGYFGHLGRGFGRWKQALVALSILAGSAAAPGEARSETAPSCGAPGKPACPLQHWMRRELAAALAHKDLKGLERGFEALVRINPEPKKWANWNKFAKDGAEAAREGRARGAIAACAHCHSIYRPEYNAKYRARVVPAK